ELPAISADLTIEKHLSAFIALLMHDPDL
ncbi:murein tripeptide amidase MpaA, partial [Vibrio parahaemolyticus]